MGRQNRTHRGIGAGQYRATLSKLSMDCCLYMNQNFAFISFPEELTTGSSIMPHKKNPDVFELIRSRQPPPGIAQRDHAHDGQPASGYHRDLQLIKEHIIPAFETCRIASA